MGVRRKRWLAAGLGGLAALLAIGLFLVASGLFAPRTKRARTPGLEPALHVSVSSRTVRSPVLGGRSAAAAAPSSLAVAEPSGRAEGDGPSTDASQAGQGGEPLATAPAVAAASSDDHTLARRLATPRLKACPSELRLVGSAVNARRPELSRAVVRSGPGAFVVGVGGRVGDFVVEVIRAASAELRGREDERCLLSGAASEAASAPHVDTRPAVAASPEPRLETKPKALFSRQELTGGVRALGGGAYQVSRELLLKGLGNPGGAASGAWFRPHVREGRSEGMEVRAVRDGSPLAALGIATGDVARTINGIAVDSPDGLLEALRAVRESNTITISIVRDDGPRELRYFVD